MPESSIVLVTVITPSVFRNCAVEQVRDKSINYLSQSYHYSPVCVFLHARLLACLSVCPFFVVVAGLWGNPVLNSPYIHVGGVCGM